MKLKDWLSGRAGFVDFHALCALTEDKVEDYWRDDYEMLGNFSSIWVINVLEDGTAVTMSYS